MSTFKITDAVRIRQFVLEALLRASASIKGWEVRNGAELLVEAEHVETWIKTGKRPNEKKPKTEGATPPSAKAAGARKAARRRVRRGDGSESRSL